MKLKHSLIFLFVLFTASLAKMEDPLEAHSDKHFDKAHHDSPGNHKHEDGDLLPNHVKLYQRVLKEKRKTQVASVDYVLQLGEWKKQGEFVKKLVEHEELVLRESREKLEKIKYEWKLEDFPVAETPIKAAMEQIVESTAFLAEIALKVPHTMEKRFKNDKFQALFRWSYAFSFNFGIYDEATSKMMNLAGQQLEIIPREDYFTNPYDIRRNKEDIEREALAKMEEARKAKAEAKKHSLKSGKKSKPSMSKNEL